MRSRVVRIQRSKMNLERSNTQAPAEAETPALNSRDSLLKHMERHPSLTVHDRVERTEKTLAIDDLIEKHLPAYFASYNGEERVPDNMRELTTACYSEDKFTMAVPDANLPFEEFYETVVKHHEQGTLIQVESIEKHPEGIEYQIHVLIPGEFDGSIRTVAEVEEGKIVRLVPQVSRASILRSIVMIASLIRHLSVCK